MKTTKTKAAGKTAPASSGAQSIVNAETADPAAVAPASAKLADARFPIVGIGASAGGLAAFEAFFAGMPLDNDPNMAFVLVQHLAPDHKSILADLVRRYTRMQVFEVEDGMVVQANCTYIIPPGCDMAFLNGTLQLLEPSFPRGQRLPIDFFFRSLAHDQHERAIGIILSGTGSDGTLGVRAIKGEGGMVMVQSPTSTEFDGMPRSALATGLVDYELPPTEMPAQLIAYTLHAFGRPANPNVVPTLKTESALKKVFILLRAQTRHDFSQYKPSTVHRRIERRMAVHQINGLTEYVRYLQQTPAEVEALFRDLLIGVTNFFRDPEAFTVLEAEAIPKLFADQRADAVIRVWSAGCSTGEEAYSLAILLVERMEALKQSFTVQVFATDIDSRAIATARAGVYPASIATDLTPERLARYFSIEPGGGAYRIHKGIRDMMVFSEQDLIKDPPFSKLDLIVCRNLLIYLGAGLQKQLIPLFHYALKPAGFLFLGTSEGVGDFDALFSVLNRKAKLYRRKVDTHGLQRAALSSFLPRTTALAEALPARGAKPGFSVKLPLRELTEQALLQQVVAAGALINDRGDILYLHGRTGMFLEPTAGEAGINNILKMARDGLRHELATTLHKAVGTRDAVHCPGLRVKTNGHHTTVNLTIRPVTTGAGATPDAPLYLVILEEVADSAVNALSTSAASEVTPTGAVGLIASLQQDLRAKEEYLQSTREELESSTEELKSSNEEMQSVNEELQSTNEELETSKEELQSVNEELATVNNELQTKVADLSRSVNDMNNLESGTEIGTVFVDHQLRILRFTAAASAIINLIPSDVGRPVAHIVLNLVNYSRLVLDVQMVLASLQPNEQEVQSLTGTWYTMRIQPYRTLDNIIEGAVLTFVDITKVKNMQLALAAEHQKLETTLSSITDGLLVLDRHWRFTYSSLPAAKLIGMRPEELIGRCVWDLFPHAKDTKFYECYHRAVATGQPLHFEEYYPAPIGKWLECSCYPSPEGLSVYFHDISERKRAEEALRKANEQLRLAVVVRDAHDAVTVQDMEGRIIAWNPGAVRQYGWNETEALQMKVQDRIPPGLREGALDTLRQLARAEVLAPYWTERLTKEGKKVAVSIISSALVNEAGQMYAIATTERLSDARQSPVVEAGPS